MKKHGKKTLALMLALVFIMTLAACGKQPPAPSTPASVVPSAQPTAPEGNEPESGTSGSDWTSFQDWQSEDWDAKTVSYQFTGEWNLEEYAMNFRFCINLYEDGSALVDQRNISSAGSYLQYGYWSEEETQDGNEIAFNTLYVVNIDDTLIAHEYSYQLYQESDGGYSFGYDFGIAPGSFFRTVDVVGSDAVTYATLEEFHAAVDDVSETYHFVNSNEVEGGFSAVISIMGDNSVTADLCTEYEGATVSAYQETGVLKVDLVDGSTAYTLVIGEVEIPLTISADGVVEDFQWTAVWDTVNVSIDFTMTQTELPAAE